MGKISELSDELLIKIISFVPTKVAVSTSILSKQWEFLWMWLPKLDYDESSISTFKRRKRLWSFLDRNLPLHRAPVIESFRLKLIRSCSKPKNIRMWIDVAVSRHIRELEISYNSEDLIILPSSLFTCKSLVILKLKESVLLYVPETGCLPCLKTLQLQDVRYFDKQDLQRFLSFCPVLQDLSVHLFPGRIFMEEFSIIVPSLQSLSLLIPHDWFLDGYKIDTPNLKYLKLEDWNVMRHYIVFENMPELREAYIDVLYPCIKNVIGSITSVNRLTICSEDVYGDGFVFNQLKHLKLCVCKGDSLSVLAQLLKDSPNLQVLDISRMKYHGNGLIRDMVYWNQPSSAPECLLSSLQTLSWSGYLSRREDRDIVVYFLQNASCLKVATISSAQAERRRFVPTLDMLKDLSLSPRASAACELVLVEDKYYVGN